MSVFDQLEPERKKYAQIAWDIIKNRRAMRWIYSYEEKPVPKDILEQIIDAGCQAPSPEN